jgi:hypothetical protein
MPIGRLAKILNQERIWSRLPIWSTLTAKCRASADTHTHSLLTWLCACSTHTQWVTKGKGGAVDQGNKGQPYKTLSNSKPSSVIDQASSPGKSPEIKSTRTGRAALLFYLSKFTTESNQDHKHKEEQGKHQFIAEAILYTNTLFLGAGVRYTYDHEQTKWFCSYIAQAWSPAHQKGRYPMFVSSYGYLVIWFKQT